MTNKHTVVYVFLTNVIFELIINSVGYDIIEGGDSYGNSLFLYQELRKIMKV